MHSKLKITRVAIISLIFAIIGCEKKIEEPYVAKVGDSYLTEELLNKVIPDSEENIEFREAYKRQWIEEQLLYLAAEEKGILNTDDYKTILKRTKTKTANSLLINELMKDTNVKMDSTSVRGYFEKHPSEFKLTSQAMIFNYASFVDYNHAENFRKSLFNYSWADAVNQAEEQEELYDSGEDVFSYIAKETPDIYKRVYKTLYSNQISDVMITMNNMFIVFQLLEKHNANEIPELNSIYDQVKERYAATQRELAYKNYIKELYSTYSSRIER